MTTTDRDLTLHLGSGKTGTSSIQSFLHHNRARLAEAGYLYPRRPGRTRHSRLGLLIAEDETLDSSHVWRRQRVADPATFRRRFRRRLLREIEESGSSFVVMSDEGLYGSTQPALRNLRALTDVIADRLRLVVYLRRQDDHLISRYQEVVKVGETRRLADWARSDFTKTYDYHARLRTFARILEPDHLVVRRFERASFVEQSLYQDFLDAAGMALRADDLDPVDVRNESLDAESVEFLRLLNVHRVQAEGVRPRSFDHREYVGALASASSGPALTLPSSELDVFMSRWEASNRAVADEHFHDPIGQLFRQPRKNAGTTTEQRLDPTRVAHFITLLGLPEPYLTPLRELAEREARGR